MKTLSFLLITRRYRTKIYWFLEGCLCSTISCNINGDLTFTSFSSCLSGERSVRVMFRGVKYISSLKVLSNTKKLFTFNRRDYLTDFEISDFQGIKKNISEKEKDICRRSLCQPDILEMSYIVCFCRYL